MNEVEKIAIEKLSNDFNALKDSMEEIFNIADNEPEKLRGRIQNYGVTRFRWQVKDIDRVINAFKTATVRQ